MTDPGSVAAAYAAVLGGIALYAVSIARRRTAAHRAKEALDRARTRDGPDPGEPSQLPPVFSERSR